MAIELLRPTAHDYTMCVLSRHGGVYVRRYWLVVGVLVAIAATASTTVMAMDEQRGPAPAASPDSPKAQVQDSSAPSKSDGGTEIRIPGLGKLGTLPKMDFGLELLYGAAESKPAQDVDPQENNSNERDMLIHGSVKHRF